MIAIESPPPTYGQGIELTPGSAITTSPSILCEVEIIAGERPPGFIQTSMIGDMTLVRSTNQAGRLVSARSDQLIRRSRIDNFLLGLVVKGDFAIRQARHEAVPSPGELILIDSLRKYELNVSAALDLIVLKIARKSVETQILEHGRYLGRTLKTDQGVGVCRQEYADRRHCNGAMYQHFRSQPL